MMRGDLILYKSRGAWYERIIAMATHGPYVHAALVVDSNRVIAADTQGIEYDTLPPADDLHTVVSLAPYMTPDGIERGLAWAEQQRGKRYGWTDIVYQGVKFLAPNNPFQLVQRDHWDCSDFATRYLLHSGVQLPDAYSDPYANTPNDLARLFGLLAPRKTAPRLDEMPCYKK